VDARAAPLRCHRRGRSHPRRVRRQSQFRLRAGVIASFGSGSTLIDIRVIAPEGVAAHASQLRSDIPARKQAGTMPGREYRQLPSGGNRGHLMDRSRALGRGAKRSRALALLELVPARPLYARAASDNAGSLRVLQNAASSRPGRRHRSPPGGTQDIEETILRLDA
jgi:hypothetical protein